MSLIIKLHYLNYQSIMMTMMMMMMMMMMMRMMMMMMMMMIRLPVQVLLRGPQSLEVAWLVKALTWSGARTIWLAAPCTTGANDPCLRRGHALKQPWADAP